MEYTLAALVLALPHLETAVSCLFSSKNETELLLSATKSNAFHLHIIKYHQLITFNEHKLKAVTLKLTKFQNNY
jgi:hypothetical protein